MTLMIFFQICETQSLQNIEVIAPTIESDKVIITFEGPIKFERPSNGNKGSPYISSITSKILME